MAAEIEDQVEESVVEYIHETEDFFEQHKQKILIGGAILLALIALAIFIFAKFLPDRNKKAQREMFLAEMAFAKDSFPLALNGNGVTKGFKDIKSKYSFTKSANLCNFYIGICNLNMKKYDEAISALKDYSTSDPVSGAAKLNAIGDAYAELNKTDDATNYYEKAANFADNDQFTPYYLFKLGMYNENNKKYKDAVAAYETIQKKYPNSDEGREIEKYITRAASAK